MSTAAAAKSDYAKCDEFIDYQIQVARRRIKWTELLTALLLAGVLLIGYVLIFTIFDHWIVSGGFGAWPRATMLVVVIAICLGIVYRYVVRPWSRQISALYAARMLDREDPEFEGSLLSAVDLNAAGVQTPATIRRAIEKRAAVRLSNLNLDEAIDRRWLMKLGTILFLLVMATCLYAVFSPKGIDLWRPLTTAQSTVATTTRILKVSPGDAIIDAGQQLTISADIAGEPPESIFITYSTADKTYVDQIVTMQPTDDDGRYRGRIIGESDRGLRQDITYFVTAGDAVSPAYQVSVTQPPRAVVESLSYTYPEYMDLGTNEVYQGNIDVWDGTRIRLQGSVNVPVRSAIVRFSDDATFSVPAEEFNLETDGTQISGQFTLKLREDKSAPSWYRVEVEDEDGRVDPAPTVYSVKVRPDKAPIVRLLDPIRDLRVPANAVVPLLAAAEDPDFLLKNVRLNYEVNGTQMTPLMLFDGARSGMRKSWSGSKDFDLAPLELSSGDVVKYFISARDNNPPLGSQSASAILQLVIEDPVSEQEVEQRLKQDHEHQEQLQKQNPGDSDSPQDQTNNDDSATGRETGNDSESQTGSEPGEQAEGSESAGQTSPGGESRQSDDGGTSQEDTNPAGSTSDDSGSSSTTEASESDGSGGESGKRESASEDEALQKLIERYRESGSDSASDSDSADDNNVGDDEPVGDPSARETNGDRSDTADAPEDGNTPPAETDAGSNSAENDARTVDNPSAGESNEDKSDTTTEPSTDGPQDNEDGSDPDSGDPQNADPQNADPQNADPQNADPQNADPQNADPQNADPQNADPQNADPQNADPQNADPQNADPQNADPQNADPQNADPQNADPQNADPQNADPQNADPQNADPQNADPQNADPQSNKGSDGKGSDGKGSDGKGSDGKGSDGKGSDDKGSDDKGSDGKGSDDKGSDGKGSDGKGSDGKGSDGKGSDGKGSDGKGSDGKGSDGKGSDGKGSDGKGSDGKGSDGKGSDGKGSDGKGFDGKGADGKGSDGKGSDGKGSDGKGSDGKGSDGKGSDGKGSDGKGSDGKGSDGKGSDGKGSEGQDGGSAGPSSQGTGGKSGGSGQASGGGANANRQAGGPGGTAGEDEAGNRDPAGSGSGSGEDKFNVGDKSVEDAAQAADLALKRLKRDLERGKVDDELLEELGWTEDQLKEFSDRMYDQLNSLKKDPVDGTSDRLQRRRVEELLKSLDLKQNSGERIGRSDRDRFQQDTTARQSRPPAQYREWLRRVQESVSRGRQQP